MSPDRVVVDTGVIMAVVAYRSNGDVVINTEKPFDIMYRDDFRSPGRSTLQAEELGRAALCGTPADGDSPSRFSVLQEVLP